MITEEWVRPTHHLIGTSLIRRSWVSKSCALWMRCAIALEMTNALVDPRFGLFQRAH
jgi:hypothetical protein